GAYRKPGCVTSQPPRAASSARPTGIDLTGEPPRSGEVPLPPGRVVFRVRTMAGIAVSFDGARTIAGLAPSRGVYALFAGRSSPAIATPAPTTTIAAPIQN